MSDFDALVDQLRECGDDEDKGRLLMGELAHLLRGAYGDTGLKKATIDAHLIYTTVAERRRVVEYYQELEIEDFESAGQIAAGSSRARDMLAEFPVLRWTHLRVAKGLSRDDPYMAWKALVTAINEAMTPDQFKLHVAKLKRQRGIVPTRVVIRKAGYTTTITDSQGGREHRVSHNGKDGDE